MCAVYEHRKPCLILIHCFRRQSESHKQAHCGWPPSWVDQALGEVLNALIVIEQCEGLVQHIHLQIPQKSVCAWVQRVYCSSLDKLQQNHGQIISRIWLFSSHHIGLTQKFIGVAGADLHHDHVQRITPRLANFLQSTPFILLLQYFILSWITEHLF